VKRSFATLEQRVTEAGHDQAAMGRLLRQDLDDLRRAHYAHSNVAQRVGQCEQDLSAWREYAERHDFERRIAAMETFLRGLPSFADWDHIPERVARLERHLGRLETLVLSQQSFQNAAAASLLRPMSAHAEQRFSAPSASFPATSPRGPRSWDPQAGTSAARLMGPSPSTHDPAAQPQRDARRQFGPPADTA
jgi:hypothetical protein